jgi:hypothetical protein
MRGVRGRQKTKTLKLTPLKSDCGQSGGLGK